MSNRKVVIASCADCQFFDNEYHDFLETCTKLSVRIVADRNGDFPIPDCCPLPKTEEELDGF